MITNIWWIRRDLRLHDNEALTAALGESGKDQVIPLFIIDPNLWQGRWVSQKRAAFLVDSLHLLDAQLQQHGSSLVIRAGRPIEVLEKITAEHDIQQIFAERDFSPYALKRDGAILHNLRIPLTLVNGSMVNTPLKIHKSDGEPYKVYTPYMQRWKEQTTLSPFNILPIPKRITTPANIRTVNLPDIWHNAEATGFPPGENEALRRLERFTDGPDAPIYRYAEQRDRPDLNSTSGLSPYLKFGMLSIRQAVVSAQAAMQAAPDEASRQGAETWLNELIWREFHQMILYHYPHALKGAFRKQYQRIRWVNGVEDFEAWKAGKTGYPLVDAAMRQVAKTGWMHNRPRMLTASFLVKNLMVDWRWGENWFMQNLLDGDPAANNGGWQWTAGTGTDAAPYFRVFNPVTQSKKFDPDGEYIRRWLPELRRVPDKYIHTPWEMDRAAQEAAGCLIGIHYPEPIIDLKFSRERVLDMYKQAVS